MRSEAVVVGGIGFQSSARMCLAQDNDVVQTFTPDRSDQPIDKVILRRGWCSWFVPDAHGAQSARDDTAIDSVPIGTGTCHRCFLAAAKAAFSWGLRSIASAPLPVYTSCVDTLSPISSRQPLVSREKTLEPSCVVCERGIRLPDWKLPTRR